MDNRETNEKIKRALVALVTVGTAAGTGLRMPAAHAAPVTAGACVLKIELTATSTVPPVPPVVPPTPVGSPTWSLGGGGLCVVNDLALVADATVSGTLSGVDDEAIVVGCAVAVLSGSFTIDVDAAGYGSMTGGARAVAAGASAVLTAVLVPSFVAGGSFVQSPFDLHDCAVDNGATTMTWKGVLAFEDPVV